VPFDPVSEVVPATAPQAVDTASAAAGITESVPVTPTAPLLSFEQQPTNTPVGAIVAPPVTVWLRDHTGAGMAGVAVALSIVSGPAGAVLHGAMATTGVDGRATFASLWLDRTGTFRLRAAAANVTVDSAPFDVVPLQGFTQVSAGAYYTCGVRVDAPWAAGKAGTARARPSGTFTQLSAVAITPAA
jgi:hypothetical protein